MRLRCPGLQPRLRLGKALIVVNAYLLRALPYPEAQRLYSVRYAAPGATEPRGMETLDWASLGDTVEHAIAWDLDMFYVLGRDHAEATPGAWVTSGFMQGLGIRPAFGPGVGAEAFVSGSPQPALISHHLWQSRFAGDPEIIGRRFEAYVSDRPEEAEAFTIVGVLPADFWHLNPYTDVLAPLRAPTYPYLVRLREGVTSDASKSPKIAEFDVFASGRAEIGMNDPTAKLYAQTVPRSDWEAGDAGAPAAIP